jgi:hypothetical protein
MIWLKRTEPKAKAKSVDQKGKARKEERSDPDHSEPVIPSFYVPNSSMTFLHLFIKMP